MSNRFQIQSSLCDSHNNALVVDIEEGRGSPPPKAGAYLDTWCPTGRNNQLWTAHEDPLNPGYFSVRSLQLDSADHELYIDIGVAKPSEMTDGAPLDANTTNKIGSRQLWKIGLNPATQPNLSDPVVPQTDYIFIQSYLTHNGGVPYVIDIEGWKAGTSPNMGTKLDAWHQKGAANQLWMLVPQQWTETPKITSFISNLDLKNPENITVTVTGKGFRPGATLALVGSFTPDVGDLTQASPILAASDFVGGLTVSAPSAQWALSGDIGEFYLTVTYNEVYAPTPVAAAKAHWTGAEFTHFSND